LLRGEHFREENKEKKPRKFKTRKSRRRDSLMEINLKINNLKYKMAAPSGTSTKGSKRKDRAACWYGISNRGWALKGVKKTYGRRDRRKENPRKKSNSEKKRGLSSGGVRIAHYRGKDQKEGRKGLRSRKKDELRERIRQIRRSCVASS